MDVVLVTHPSGLEHDAGWGHPERPERIGAAIAGVRLAGFHVVELAAEPIDRDLLELVHAAPYIDSIEQFCRAGGGALDADTGVVPESWTAALHSAGAGRVALDAIEANPGSVGFVAMRPPGHHALATTAMGFCLFNNVAVAAKRLTARGARVAIIDWDVHHGNGTQDTFYDDRDVLYVSFHQAPFYPFTGEPRETGAGPGGGRTINFAWPAGTNGAAYHDAIKRVVDPVLRQFEPDYVLFSAGYDAHLRDPLAAFRLQADDYGSMAHAVRRATSEVPAVMFLEGGYNLEAITTSVAASLQGLAGDSHLIETHDVPSHTRVVTDALLARLAAWYDF